MMWTDKAFGIYMGEAGTVTPLDGIAGDTDRDGVAGRPAIAGMDHCSDGDTQRSGWLTRAGSTLAERAQVRGAARG
jgi:hypothetical protein